jgi:hypothetical protein
MVALDFKLRSMVMKGFFLCKTICKRTEFFSKLFTSKSKNSYGVNEYLKHFQISFTPVSSIDNMWPIIFEIDIIHLLKKRLRWSAYRSYSRV